MDWSLVATLVVLMLAGQAACWLMARGLRLRLEPRAAAVAWLAPLILLAPCLGGDQLLVPSDILQSVPGAPRVDDSNREYAVLSDVVLQLLPWEIEVRRALSDGRLPFWSDALEGGSSLWANPQARALSPLHMAARALPVESHLAGALALATLIGFQGTWLLARLTGRSRPASLLAALGFALGGGISAWALFPITTTVAWVPWLAAATVRIVRRPDGGAAGTAAIITAALLLSGHPETALFGGLFAAVCGLGLRRRGRFIPGAGAAFLAAILGFGLAALHLLPFVELIPDSRRAYDALAHVRANGQVSVFYPLTWFVPGFGQHMLAPFGPHVYGRPYQDPFAGPFNWPEAEAAYTGLLAFAGTAIAALAVRDRRLWPFLGFAVGALLIVARVLPFAYLADVVPLLRVPAYARLLPSVAVALCVAGAFGVDAIAARRREALVWGALALAVIASLAVRTDGWTVVCWLALIAACAATRWRPRWGTAALGVVLLVDLVPWSWAMLPKGHPSLFYPRTPVMTLLEREAGDPSTSRVAGGDLLLYPNVLAAYGLADFRTHSPLAPDRYLQVLGAAFDFSPSTSLYFAPLRNLDHPLLDFLGVRLVAGSPSVPPSRTLERIDGDRFLPLTLWRNPDPLPRWFVPSSVERVAPGELKTWITQMRTPDRVAVFEDDPGAWSQSRPERPPVRVVSSRPGLVELEVRDDGDRLLASSVPWSRGWSARAGELSLRTLPVNGAFLGVHLPAGVSRVELRFVPPGFIAGSAASAASALLTLYCFRRTRRRRSGVRRTGR